MNCDSLRDHLYDYLDNSLSPSDKAAAERHLAGCHVCREAVRRESQLAQSLSRALQQAVEPVALDSVTRRSMAAAVERKIAGSRERSLILFRRRLALPFAAAAVILVAAIWMGYHFLAKSNSRLDTARIPRPSDVSEVFIHVSYSVPEYTFRREGNMVIDALTSETRVADSAMLVKDSTTQTNQIKL